MLVLPEGNRAGFEAGRRMKRLVWALVLPIMSEAANYSAAKAVADGIEIVRLSDHA
jgi:hypothetical protein